MKTTTVLSVFTAAILALYASAADGATNAVPLTPSPAVAILKSVPPQVLSIQAKPKAASELVPRKTKDKPSRETLQEIYSLRLEKRERTVFDDMQFETVRSATARTAKDTFRFELFRFGRAKEKWVADGRIIGEYPVSVSGGVRDTYGGAFAIRREW